MGDFFLLVSEAAPLCRALPNYEGCSISTHDLWCEANRVEVLTLAPDVTVIFIFYSNVKLHNFV